MIPFPTQRSADNFHLPFIQPVKADADKYGEGPAGWVEADHAFHHLDGRRFLYCIGDITRERQEHHSVHASDGKSHFVGEQRSSSNESRGTSAILPFRVIHRIGIHRPQQRDNRSHTQAIDQLQRKHPCGVPGFYKIKNRQGNNSKNIADDKQSFLSQSARKHSRKQDGHDNCQHTRNIKG